MTDPRTLAAAVLGVGLGLLMLVAPGLVVRVHTVGRVPGGRGEYGSDDAAPRLRLLVRAVGVGVLLAGVYFGVQAAGI
ncbi:hypothetical protein [Halosegnis sp.]|uniref:hypothetical protein n=1 Tax=Halosegnis sp. TaxID=2864959 RepID=UPI0035D4CFF3